MKKAMVLFAFVCACATALAQSADTPAPLEPKRAGAASYVCGGVGYEEQQAIKAQAGNYDVMLTFAVSHGAYLADVDVEVKDGKGAVVLSVRCDGPIMLADLPGRGPWRVSAQADGETRHATVSAGRQATLRWRAGAS